MTDALHDAELARRVLSRLVEIDPDVYVTCLVPQLFM